MFHFLVGNQPNVSNEQDTSASGVS